ncbi:MAG: hypothetical protein JO250_10550, partial [Armatimonadetes bacterium]|nr:hypothetical protein [Armatimonadota bacterium]
HRPGVPDFTGYGPDFDRARAEYRRELAQAERGERHQALVEKSFLGALTPQEAQEKERLRQEIDQDSTPLFGTTRQETSPTDSEALLHEYHDLVDLELVGHLTEEQTIRLQEIKDALDEMDAQDPVEQAIDARVRETSDRLDAILNELRRQPLKPVGP